MRILVTGSRNWVDKGIIREALAEVWHPNNVLVHGRCDSGADALADACWTHWGGKVERHRADWFGPCDPDPEVCQPGHRRPSRRNPAETYCPAAGPRRNRHMVNLGADLCIAFILARSPGSIGCAFLAGQAGIPLRVRHSGVGAAVLKELATVGDDTTLIPA
ncbi:SLOG family protein [Amycolatopsis thermophila]|uniref:YspA cpYpsA-related SLOG domain-containing protein n=1 Tax=Amycolatopsis thermophila TaxID=206084 RepID=A0ABU0EN07_9PSEU|nr:SLOG family protein [Amycolatopsis thermophila]MDQ0376622.1 hypothetical protein [Amycolatopsis thermophila]